MCWGSNLISTAETFKSFFPKIHEYYKIVLLKLYQDCLHLWWPYENLAMPVVAYNLGPAIVCCPHQDSANLSFGICAIMVLSSLQFQEWGASGAIGAGPYC
ncbi:hypothetical protein J3R83DRAFT_11297 [Lanmaoa asiatica]|nr:hypothetical protein J3R83DRAFT_11297 [Lanmaoa asiatica]